MERGLFLDLPISIPVSRNAQCDIFLQIQTYEGCIFPEESRLAKGRRGIVSWRKVRETREEDSGDLRAHSEQMSDLDARRHTHFQRLPGTLCKGQTGLASIGLSSFLSYVNRDETHVVGCCLARKGQFQKIMTHQQGEWSI